MARTEFNTVKIQEYSNVKDNLLRKEIMDMRNIRIGISAFLFTLLIGVLTAVPGWTQAQGPGNCAGPTLNIFDRVPVTVEGTVVGIGEIGQEIQIDTGGGIFVIVYGIGPIHFWNDIGIDRPGVGEPVSIEGYEVTFSDESTKIIASSITIGEGENTVEILLRDETGAPVWRGPGHTFTLRYQHEHQNRNDGQN